MKHNRIPVRYAKALFSLAKDRELLDVIYKDIALVFKSCSEIEVLKSFLTSPVASVSQKRKALVEIFSGKVDALTLSFIELVACNKREIYLVEIARNFLDAYKKFHGIKTATITTATPLEEESRKMIVELIQKAFNNNKVELQEKTKESLIGGLIIRIDDNEVDASIAAKLMKLKRLTINKSFEKRYIQTTFNKNF